MRVNKLEGTISNLMKKALESLPPDVATGVRPPVQGKNNLTSPLWDDHPPLLSVSRGWSRVARPLFFFFCVGVGEKRVWSTYVKNYDYD